LLANICACQVCCCGVGPVARWIWSNVVGPVLLLAVISALFLVA
jgi:hypothetical protein